MHLYIVAALIALSGFGVWKVQEWRHAAIDKERIEAAAEKARFDRRAVDAAATGHEKDKRDIRAAVRPVTKEVERIAREEPFYAPAAPACLDDAGLRQLEAAITGPAPVASQPAGAVRGLDAPKWWKPRRDASVER